MHPELRVSASDASSVTAALSEANSHDFVAVDTQKTVICETPLDEKAAEQFKYAIQNHYWYELFMGKSC